MAESKNDAFSEVVKRLVSEMVKPSVLPSVKANVVEAIGLQMVKAGYEMSEWSVGVLTDYLKGYNLWLCGNPGVGKTFFFDCINTVRTARGINPIRKLSMIETQGWTMDIARQWTDETQCDDLLIDDVGTEPEMNSYGVKAELFPYLLESRMGLRKRTHLTSNLGVANIKKRYGIRVIDRFVQFFKMEQYPETVGGKKTGSRRKLAPWKVDSAGRGVL